MKRWKKQGSQYLEQPWISFDRGVIRLNAKVNRWANEMDYRYVEIWYESDWTLIELRFYRKPGQDRYKISRGRVCAKALLDEVRKRGLKIIEVKYVGKNRLGIWLR